MRKAMEKPTYNFTDRSFFEKLKEVTSRGGNFQGHFLYGGREIPGMIEELTQHGESVFFLSNDSRWNGGRGKKNTHSYQYSYELSFGNRDINFRGEFEDPLAMVENPTIIAVNKKTGIAGSFESTDKVAEYLTNNPGVELRYFKIENEIKPQLQVKFE